LVCITCSQHADHFSSFEDPHVPTRVRFRLTPSKQFWSALHFAAKKASYTAVLFGYAAVLSLRVQSRRNKAKANHMKVLLTMCWLLATHLAADATDARQEALKVAFALDEDALSADGEGLSSAETGVANSTSRGINVLSN
jgi:hypothetical protein